MSQIIVQPGIVLIEIRGSYILVALREARKKCRYYCLINSTAAYLWKMLIEGKSFLEILTGFTDKYKIEDIATLERDLRICLEQMKEAGYIRFYPNGGADHEV